VLHLAAARCAGRPPPVAAHGAVVDAHCRAGRLDAALAAVQRLVDAGGAPDARIYDRLVDAAMRGRDFQRALQVPPALLNCLAQL
jgi:pentatricopeptide repeat protein